MYSRSAELALLYCRDWQGRLKKGSIQVVEKCSTNGYDIIGDIHGHGAELIALLESLGYFHDGISYLHPPDQSDEPDALDANRFPARPRGWCSGDGCVECDGCILARVIW